MTLLEALLSGAAIGAALYLVLRDPRRRVPRLLTIPTHHRKARR